MKPVRYSYSIRAWKLEEISLRIIEKYAKSNRELLAPFAEVVKAVGWGVVEYIETDFARKNVPC